MASEKPGGLPIPYRAESIDAFLQVLQRRRSIRTGFLRDKPVPDELIEKILEAARWAPSAGNSQPWEFIVIRDLEIRENIVEIFKTLEEIVHHERYDRSKFRGEAELQDFMMKMSIRGTEYSSDATQGALLIPA